MNFKCGSGSAVRFFSSAVSILRAERAGEKKVGAAKAVVLFELNIQET